MWSSLSPLAVAVPPPPLLSSLPDHDRADALPPWTEQTFGSRFAQYRGWDRHTQALHGGFNHYPLLPRMEEAPAIRATRHWSEHHHRPIDVGHLSVGQYAIVSVPEEVAAFRTLYATRNRKSLTEALERLRAMLAALPPPSSVSRDLDLVSDLFDNSSVAGDKKEDSNAVLLKSLQCLSSTPQ